MLALQLFTHFKHFKIYKVKYDYKNMLTSMGRIKCDIFVSSLPIKLHSKQVHALIVQSNIVTKE